MRPIFIFLLGLAFALTSRSQILPDAYLLPDFPNTVGYDGDRPVTRVCHDFFQTLQAANIPAPPFQDGKYWLRREIEAAILSIQNDDSSQLQVLHFPPGTYVLQDQVNLSGKGARADNIVIKGAGAAHTHFIWTGSERDCFNVTGSWTGQATPASGTLGNTFATAPGLTSAVEADDHLMLLSEAIDDFVEGNHTGQTIRILRRSGDSLFFPHHLRANFNDPSASIRRMDAPQNIGFECFSIDGSDNATPDPRNQASHFRFEFASNCWVRGVESRRPIFQHVVIERSSNIEVSGCYFHEASQYTGSCGGCGYGVNLQNASSECLIVNNIFRRLRHAVLLQFGANGNAVAYNYSFDSAPGADTQKDDFAFHGAWPYRNVMEGNVVEEIRFTRRREWNGNHNIVFRNATTRKGISTAQRNDEVAVVGNVTAGCVDFGASNNENNLSWDNRQEGTWCKGKHGGDGVAADLGDSYVFADRPAWFLEGQGEWPPIDPVAGVSEIPARWRWRFGRERVWAADCHGCQELGAVVRKAPCLAEEGFWGTVRLDIIGGEPPYAATWLATPGIETRGESLDLIEFRGAGMLEVTVSDSDPATAPISLQIETTPCEDAFLLSGPDTLHSPNSSFTARIHPNPITDLSLLEIDLPTDGPLTVEIHDLAGRRVLSICQEKQQSTGRYQLPIPANALAPGIYLCHIEFAGERLPLRLLVR